MDVMNIIMAVIGLVGLKRAPECIKMHHFEGENSKIFLGGGCTGEVDTPSPDPTPVDAFGASIRVPSALDPPDHISGYGPGGQAPQIFFPRTAPDAGCNHRYMPIEANDVSDIQKLNVIDFQVFNPSLSVIPVCHGKQSSYLRFSPFH